MDWKKILILIGYIFGINMGLFSVFAFIDVLGTELAPPEAATLAITGLITIILSIICLILTYVVTGKSIKKDIILIAISALGICLVLPGNLILILPYLLFLAAGIISIREQN